MTEIEKYYNKFNEDHRLTTRHGTVEFLTSLHFIQHYIDILRGEIQSDSSIDGQRDCQTLQTLQNCGTLQNGGTLKNSETLQNSGNLQAGQSMDVTSGDNKAPLKILDIGAGTGRYSVELCHRGHDVTAVELVPRNLEVLRSKHENIKTWKGNATNLSFLDDQTFDITIMFGPLYHLQTREEKIQAYREARRVTKKGGYIFAAYIMNEYALIQYCFKERNILDCIKRGELTEDFHCVTTEKSLYSYQRLCDIDSINQELGQKPLLRFSQEGAADYMRRELNALSPEEFDLFVKYHLATCTRPELLGASSHVVDVIGV